MKIKLITLLIIFSLIPSSFTGNSLYAASTTDEVPPIFREGDMVLNLGLGLGSVFSVGRHYSTRIPPIAASFEMGFLDDFLTEDMTLGIGGYLGFTSSKWEFANYGWTYNYIIIGGRSAVHYPLVENLDTYGGVMLGVNLRSASGFGYGVEGESSTRLSLAWSGYVGGRYYFSESFAAMAELGYGIAYLTIGVAMKLN